MTDSCGLELYWWRDGWSVQGRGVEKAFVHMLVWTVFLTGFISQSGWPFLYMWPHTHAASLSSYYRFPWNLFIGPLMLRDHFLPFSFIPPLENRTVAKEKEVRGPIQSFILQTQTHADTYQRKISPRLPSQLSSDFICGAMQLDTPTRALFG